MPSAATGARARHPQPDRPPGQLVGHRLDQRAQPVTLRGDHRNAAFEQRLVRHVAATLRSFELPSRLVDTSTPGGKLPSGQTVPKVNVLLPDGYDPHSKRGYPVLWLLHGANGGTDSWIPGKTKLKGITKIEFEPITAEGAPTVAVITFVFVFTFGSVICKLLFGMVMALVLVLRRRRRCARSRFRSGAMERSGSAARSASDRR